MNIVENLAPEKPSICIPFVYRDVTDDEIINIFSYLNIGNGIEIDWKPTTNKDGNRGRTIYIYFSEWKRNSYADKTRLCLIEGNVVSVEYRRGAFWKICAKRNTPPKEIQPRFKPRTPEGPPPIEIQHFRPHTPEGLPPIPIVKPIPTPIVVKPKKTIIEMPHIKTTAYSLDDYGNEQSHNIDYGCTPIKRKSIKVKKIINEPAKDPVVKEPVVIEEIIKDDEWYALYGDLDLEFEQMTI